MNESQLLSIIEAAKRAYPQYENWCIVNKTG
jgi:hypothetical protein